MHVNIDIVGDILIQGETDFETNYLQQFDCCVYSAFVKCGTTPADVIGLKLRKTSKKNIESPNSAESKPVDEAQPCGEYNNESDAIALCKKYETYKPRNDNECPALLAALLVQMEKIAQQAHIS